jgi:hypothetical protein
MALRTKISTKDKELRRHKENQGTEKQSRLMFLYYLVLHRERKTYYLSKASSRWSLRNG